MTDVVLAVIGAMTLVFVVGTIVIWRVVRRAGHRIGGWHWRYIEMRTRFLPHGPRRDAGRLRCRLHREMLATRDMLTSAPQGLIFRADAAGVLQELMTASAALDAELAAIERFIDTHQQRAAVVALTPQVNALIDMTYSARQTVLRTAAADRTRHIAALRDTVATQAAALETYQRNGRELSL